jgi:hypothetical protein
MILYEVTVTPDAAIASAFETYMREKHIREVLDTGCFTGARFAAAPGGKYRTSYSAATQEELDRYLRLHAARLRDDFAAHFPAGVAVSRETWQVLEEWRS